MADELADEDLVDYEEEVEEGDDKPTEEVKKYAAAALPALPATPADSPQDESGPRDRLRGRLSSGG